jgi:PAS domain S-box-containing protein
MSEPLQINVLLVEDNPADARLIRELLVEARPANSVYPPFRLERASRLEQGLQLFQDFASRSQGGFDIALLDLSLPDSQGLETFHRAQSGLPNLPIILLTGLDDEKLAGQAIAEGAQDYLVKGVVNADTLGRAIRYGIERSQVSKALRASESLFRALADSSPSGVYLANLEGQTLYVNPRWTEITGLKARDALGNGWLNAIHPEDRERVAGWLEMVKLEQRWNEEFRYVHKSGAVLWVYNTTHPVVDQQGRITGYIGSVIDITERKNREIQLRLLTSGLEAAANGVMITDLTGAIQWVNPAFTALTGFTAQEAYLNNPRQLVRSGLHNPEFYKDMWDTILAGKVWRGEVVNRHKNGALYTEDMTITPVRAEGRAISYFIAIQQDITARKQMQEALQWDLNLSGALSDLYLPLLLPDSTLQQIAGVVLKQALRLTGSTRGYVSSAETGEAGMICHVHWHEPVSVQAGSPADEADFVPQDSLETCPDLCKINLPPHEAFYAERSTFASRPELFGGQAPSPQLQRLLAVPVALAGETVGHIFLANAPGPYTGRDLEAIRRLGEYYAVAIQRWRADEALRRARDESQRLFEAERKQRLLAETLGEISQKMVLEESVSTVLDGLLDLISRVIQSDASSIVMIEGSNGRLTQGRGYDAFGSWEQVKGALIDLDLTRDVRQMFHSHQPYLIADTTKYEGWVFMPGREWVRSYALVPLVIRSQAIGWISLDSATPGFFSPEVLDRLKMFADLATIALHKARLLEETRRQLSDLQVVNRISIALRSAQHLDEMLEVLLDQILGDLGTSTGSVWLYEPAAGGVLVRASRGWYANLGKIVLRIDQGIIGKVFSSGEIYRSADIMRDPFATPAFATIVPPDWCGVWVPVRAGQTVVGVIVVARPTPASFSANEENLLSTLAEIAGNAIHRMRLNEQTEQRLKYLSALRQIDAAIANNRDLHSTLTVLLDQSRTQLEIDAADVLLFNSASNTLDYAAGRGFYTRLMESVSLQVGQGPAGRSALERRIVYISDLNADSSSLARQAVLSGEKFIAYYGVPLQLKGMLEIFHRSSLNPQPEWLDFLESLAGQAAIAIETAQLFEGLQRSRLELALAYESTLEGWSRTLDMRDEDTEGHTQRVVEMTLRLARLSGFSEAEIVHIRRGALLHDIGKIAVPDRILLKPGPLDADELIIMRQHPVFAYQALAPIEYLRLALDIPYCHHERWDGSGYPRRLKGEEIPRAARLFAVVDVWDALSSDRPYRKAWEKEQVLAYLGEHAGSQFDPRAVELFLKLV